MKGKNNLTEFCVLPNVQNLAKARNTAETPDSVGFAGHQGALGGPSIYISGKKIVIL